MKRSAILGLLLGMALAGTIVACAPSSSSREVVRPPRIVQVPLDARVMEIAELWGTIRRWRQEADWGSNPSTDLIRVGAVCPETSPPTCDDTCNLADHICENSEAICELAGELGRTPNREWAREKCEDSKNSCKEARKRCSCCQQKNGHGDEEADGQGTW